MVATTLEILTWGRSNKKVENCCHRKTCCCIVFQFICLLIVVHTDLLGLVCASLLLLLNDDDDKGQLMRGVGCRIPLPAEWLEGEDGQVGERRKRGGGGPRGGERHLVSTRGERMLCHAWFIRNYGNRARAGHAHPIKCIYWVNSVYWVVCIYWSYNLCL